MSGIEWCDRSDWNPVRGCSRVDEGCRHCYAEALAARFSEPGQWGHGVAYRARGGPRWTGQVSLVEDRLALPLGWKKPARVFADSASDFFHEKVKRDWLDRIFAVMALAPHLDFLVLTKRPARAAGYYADPETPARIDYWVGALAHNGSATWARAQKAADTIEDNWPLPNLWLGTSVSDQASADTRIPELLACPARLRFVSYEPALGPVDFEETGAFDGHYMGGMIDFDSGTDKIEPAPRIDWVIVGGESGPGARPFYLKWAREALEQCRAAGVPVFVKQLGANAHDGGRLKLRDRKGGDMAEWPADVRVRAFPRSPNCDTKGKGT